MFEFDCGTMKSTLPPVERIAESREEDARALRSQPDCMRDPSCVNLVTIKEEMAAHGRSIAAKIHDILRSAGCEPPASVARPRSRRS